MVSNHKISFLVSYSSDVRQTRTKLYACLHLVTRSGIDLRFVARDLRPSFSHMQISQFGMQRPGMQHPSIPPLNHFGGQPKHFPSNPMHQPPQPSIIYLFTSPVEGQQPVIADTPVFIPLPPGAARPELRYCHFLHEG